jgi:superfamily I DNA/RNA helicase
MKEGEFLTAVEPLKTTPAEEGRRLFYVAVMRATASRSVLAE